MGLTEVLTQIRSLADQGLADMAQAPPPIPLTSVGQAFVSSVEPVAPTPMQPAVEFDVTVLQLSDGRKFSFRFVASDASITLASQKGKLVNSLVVQYGAGADNRDVLVSLT